MDIKDIQKALKTSDKPKKDACGDWNIFGKKGHIYHDHTYWYVMVYAGKLLSERLSFMTKWQGDGIFRSNKLPTPGQAVIIRKVAGLKRKRVLSPEHRKKALENLVFFKKKNVAKQHNDSPG